MTIEPEFAALLVCPACRGALTETESGLCCETCAVCYPVRDGIPIMLVEEAVSTVRG